MTTPTDAEKEESESSTEDTKICYRCGARLPAEARRCTNCGRKQIRVCYCGREIPVTALECPHCGADWSNSRRARRKRTKSRRIRPRGVAKAAGVGAVASLLALFVANVIISHLASYAEDPSAPAAQYPQRLGYAYEGLVNIGSTMGQTLASYQGSLLVVGLGLVIGAIIGTLLYMNRVGAIRFGKKKSSRRRRSSDQTSSRDRRH